MNDDPYDLVVNAVADAIELACKTNIPTSDISRVDLVSRYDFSGDPTTPDQTANKVLVKPDTEMGENRGDYDVSYAIGSAVRTRAYHVVVEIDSFPVRVTTDRAAVREIISKIRGRVEVAMQTLITTVSGSTTDGKWIFCYPCNPFIQGSGTEVQDAGRTQSIRGRASLVVGFVLQYLA